MCEESGLSWDDLQNLPEDVYDVLWEDLQARWKARAERD